MTAQHPNRTVLAAVVFDLDDTLYPERQYVRSGYRAVAEHLAGVSGVAPAELAAWMWRRFQAGQVDRMFNALSEAFHLGLGDAQIRQLVALYREHRPAIEPWPEADKVLARLQGRVKLGLLSDGFLPAQRHKLQALGLESAFDAVVFTEELGRENWKPSPTGFRRLEDQLGAAGPALAYVADNPAKDFVAPNQLGWLTVQWLFDRQVHAGKSAPPGGEPRVVVTGVEALLAALGLRLG